MKQIIIFLLVIIALLIGYGQYKQYKRFSPPEYKHKINENIDLNYHDKAFLLKYYQSVEALNGYVISQWSNENIDVRNPEDDDEVTKAASAEYARKLGEVNYYESQLVKSSKQKEAGLTNEDIKMLENEGISLKEHEEIGAKQAQKAQFFQLYSDAVSDNNLRLGSKSAFVFEVQKLLIKKGYDIPLDGIYKFTTSDALRKFEASNELFPDGKIDRLTLEALVN